MMGIGIAAPPCVDVIPWLKLLLPNLAGLQTHQSLQVCVSEHVEFLFT